MNARKVGASVIVVVDVDVIPCYFASRTEFSIKTNEMRWATIINIFNGEKVNVHTQGERLKAT